MKPNRTVPRVQHIQLPFGESIYTAAEIDLRHPGMLKAKLVNGRVYADSVDDPVTGAFIYRLVAHILEAQPPKEIRYRYPLTWWDHFKESCFPAWALRRWPAAYKTETTIIKDIYPFPNIDLGENLGPVYRISRMESFTECLWDEP